MGKAFQRRIASQRQREGDWRSRRPGLSCRMAISSGGKCRNSKAHFRRDPSRYRPARRLGRDSRLPRWHSCLLPVLEGAIGHRSESNHASSYPSPLGRPTPPPPRRTARPDIHTPPIREEHVVRRCRWLQLAPRSIDACLYRKIPEQPEVIAASPHAPHSVNTWGDALYAVFDFVHDAGRFAVELNEMVENKKEEWIAAGLGPLQIRTGLHAGPVFLHHDPILRRLGFSGAHVNRAARIEPVAAPGEILASEEFAALAAISPACGFSVEYATTSPLVKNYPGIHRLYRIVRDPSADLVQLAKAIHSEYCQKARERGETLDSNSALRAWDDLPPSLQSANLAQAEDIPTKLEVLGYEIVSSGGSAPSSIIIAPDLLESLASTEHDRWMAEKIRAGWIYAPERDNTKLHHPLLISYDHLPEVEKEKDRAVVLNIPALLSKAGYRVKPFP